MLGHELRNPLAGILNSLEVLNYGPSPQVDALELLAIIRRQAEQLRHITDDLLDVTRIKHGKIVLKRAPVDIVPIVRQAAEDHRRDLEARQAVLLVETPADPVYCELDATRLSQIIGNLLGNAAKFLSGPGRVTVSVSSHRESNSAVVQVSDTGIGIEAATLEEIFEPFVQASQRLNRGEGGLGLGLALVRGLVELHGGRITATSAGIGQGAEFTIELPLCAQPGADAANRGAGQDGGQRKRVLVVDDYQDALLAIRKMLELDGHEVYTAADGARAIELIREFTPHVVLCDIGLPGMSGYEFARAVRSEPGLQAVRLIAVSGYGQEEDRQRARESGFDYHLTKPVRREQLKTLIEL
jgi:CheY-like chemotaxis protein/two-component sensor histidine kinase